MTFAIIYFILGIVIGIVSWFWHSSKHGSRIEEGNICIYLFGCIFVWPAVIIGIIIDLIQFITKEYCSQEI